MEPPCFPILVALSFAFCPIAFVLWICKTHHGHGISNLRNHNPQRLHPLRIPQIIRPKLLQPLDRLLGRQPVQHIAPELLLDLAARQRVGRQAQRPVALARDVALGGHVGLFLGHWSFPFASLSMRFGVVVVLVFESARRFKGL